MTSRTKLAAAGVLFVVALLVAACAAMPKGRTDRASMGSSTRPAASARSTPTTGATAPTVAPTTVPRGPWRVVGYLTTWGAHSGYHPRNLAASGAAARLTHLNVAFGSVVDGRCAQGDPAIETGVAYDAANSVDGVADPAGQPGGLFGQLRKLKAQNPQLRVLWSFGGASGSSGFAAAASDPVRFAASCRALLDDPRWAGLFDGIDIDWEYPGLDSGYAALLAAMRREMPGRLVTAAVPAAPTQLLTGGYGDAAASVDWFNVMTYDFAGWWTPTRSAPHSALHPDPASLPAGHSASEAISTYRALGVSADKLLLGVGFYGRGWSGVAVPAAGAAASGPAPGTVESGMETYRTLVQRCPATSTVAGTAVASCGSQWWSYDTPATLSSKAAWARSQGLGGVFFWEASGDTDDGQLVAALTAGG
ncbi:MAG: glycosyl hydrolase family 18 protein [Microthrixaceae bacterium]